jgi:hypothetical protein
LGPTRLTVEELADILLDPAVADGSRAAAAPYWSHDEEFLQLDGEIGDRVARDVAGWGFLGERAWDKVEGACGECLRIW